MSQSEPSLHRALPIPPLRGLTLGLLTLQALSFFWFASYNLPTAAQQQEAGGFLYWLDPLQLTLAGIITLWLAVVLAAGTGLRLPLSRAYLRQVAVALRLGNSVVTGLRGLLWVLSFMAVAGGFATLPEPLAWGHLGFWGANIYASYQMHLWATRWFIPANAESAEYARTRFAAWLNRSAALTFMLTALNVGVIGSLLEQPMSERMMFGLGNALDIAATLAAFALVRAAPPAAPMPPEDEAAAGASA